MNDKEQSSVAYRRPLITAKGMFVFFLGMIALVFALIFGARQVVGGLSGNFSNAVSGAFQTLFHVSPKTSIQSGSTVLEKSGIAEIAVTQRKMRTVVTYRQAWLGSTKVLVIQGDFLVKAGFDLQNSFRFTTNETTHEVVVDLARPKILSTDFITTEVLYSSDGMINKLNAQDSAAVVRQMLAETKLQAQQSDMLEEASQQIEQRIKDMLQATASKITVRFHEGPLPPAAPLP